MTEGQPLRSRLRVATFNIHHGAPQGAQRARLRATESTVASFGADVVALQEVDVRSARTYFQNQANRLAKIDRLVPLFLPTRPILGGRYGIAVLTRRAVSEYWFLPLPVGVGREPRAAILFRYPLAEPSGVEAVEAPVTASIATTHLQVVRASEYHRSEAASQLHVVLSSLNELPGPRIVLGDFNLVPEVTEPILREHGFTPALTGNTFPARVPKKRIDWIATDSMRFDSVEVPDVRTSDHRPIVADLVYDHNDSSSKVGSTGTRR